MPMKEALEKIKENALKEISSSEKMEDIEAIRIKVLGRKGELLILLPGRTA
jgi:phenylalanyl-tRNA synthetase alpha chain